MELEVKQGMRSGWKPVVHQALASDTDPIFVDDLRGPDDPSLGPVPRITTLEQLVSVFHVGIATRFGGGEASPGDKYFRLVGFYIRSGVAAFIPKVLDENGNALATILVFAHWPGAPKLVIPGGGPPRPDYTGDGLGVGGFTNADGDIGFGYSGGAVIGDNGGVYTIWPAADPPGQPRQHADAALRLGWHGATDHLTPNPIWQVVTKSGATPPPPTSGDSYVSVVINGIEQAHIGLTAKATIEVA